MMVDIYNNLPQYVVDAKCVEVFQKFLTDKARERCHLGNEAWSSSFSARSADANV